MLGHPAHDGGNHRKDEAADGEADRQAEAKLELQRIWRGAGEERPEPEMDGAGQPYQARLDAVAERAQGKPAGAHRQEADGHGARHFGMRPAGRLGDRLQEHREREHGADGDAAHEGAERHHHPAVARGGAHFFASTMERMPARPCSKSPPTSLSKSNTRCIALAMKLFWPVMVQVTVVLPPSALKANFASLVAAKGLRNSSLMRTSSAGLLSTMVMRPSPTSLLPVQYVVEPGPAAGPS